jgi:uncharacterized protein (DUF1778 family)
MAGQIALLDLESGLLVSIRLESTSGKACAMPRVSVDSNPRFTMEIPPSDKARLVRAASLERTTLKDFLLRNALVAADEVIARTERLRLDEAQARHVLDLLDNPPEPNAKLIAAARLLSDQP